MKLLLDTHIWLWSLLAPGNLTARVAQALELKANELWLSPISAWELLVLVDKKRITLNTDVATWVSEAMRRVPLHEAPLTHEIALETRRIALPHRDPADHFLAATARVLGLTLVTADARLLGARGFKTLANR